MPLSEADTHTKFIDPALHNRGWTDDLIRRENGTDNELYKKFH
jgi:type I site-specific restriction endonuclease